jgi:hypothetical protein
MRPLLALLAVLVGGSCGRGNQHRVVPPPVDPSVMLLPFEAKTDRGVRWYRDGSGDLPFTIHDTDTNEIPNKLIRHFDLKRWHQRPTDKSGHPTSFQEGWVRFSGGGLVQFDDQGRVIQNESLTWHGEWRDDAGNVIAYHLSAGRRPGSFRGNVVGYATYTPNQLLH